MVEPAGIGGDRGDGGEKEFLLMEISNNGEHSCRLNFDGFQLSTEHKEKPPRGLQDCLGVLAMSSFILVLSATMSLSLKCNCYLWRKQDMN